MEKQLNIGNYLQIHSLKSLFQNKNRKSSNLSTDTTEQQDSHKPGEFLYKQNLNSK